MKRLYLSFFLCIFAFPGWSKALIDSDLKAILKSHRLQKVNARSAHFTIHKDIIIFLKQKSLRPQFIKDFENNSSVKFQAFDSLPLIAASGSIDSSLIESIANHPSVAQLSLLDSSQEELEVSEQSILLQPSSTYPQVNNWWAHGCKGEGSVIGLIDSGIATEHPSLQGKEIYIRKESNSKYKNFKNGVRSAHGTGVACIYTGMGSELFPQDLGVAHGSYKIVSGLSGESVDQEEEVLQTLGTLDWMLARAPERPHIINYSIGHGLVGCEHCPPWSGLARVVDYVINHYQILWVKSAGNNGYPKPPAHSSMTIPADNYNGLTVANMNTCVKSILNLVPFPNRFLHSIYHSSSRGPTLDGRKKPDLAAPGHDTWTCAPDPAVYPFQYSESMNYHDGYRFMGGTSSATPHVGGAIVLLRQAGITSPIAQKALLINSADAWTDNDQPGPDDPNHPPGTHYQVMGSEWNKTYGWGYLNMQKAFDQRNYVKIDHLTLAAPKKVYDAHLSVGSKVTLVHERRVGYNSVGEPWQLSHLKLEIVDKESGQVLFSDNSYKDTVHQVANCKKEQGEVICSNQKPIDAWIRVSLVSTNIDGNENEPFALSFSESPSLIE